MLLLPAIRRHEDFDASSLTTAEIGTAITEAARLKAMADSAWLAVVDRAHRLVAAPALGYRTTADLISAFTGDRLGHAKRDVELASRLAQSPLVAESFSSGDISQPKAVELVRARGVSAAERPSCLEAANSMSVKQLHERIDALLAEQGIEPAPVENAVRISHLSNGGTLTATLEPTRLNPLEIEIAIDMAVAKGRAARQLCCDAGITCIVSGPRSQPLDVGTTTRTLSGGDGPSDHCPQQAPCSPRLRSSTVGLRNSSHRARRRRGPTSAMNGELRCCFHHDLKHASDPAGNRRQNSNESVAVAA